MKPKIILASSSPRRIELLTQVGFKIEVRKPDADETSYPGEAPRALVRRLSQLKAQSVAQLLTKTASTKGALVIAADTIVVSPSGKILGKPRDSQDAVKMLKMLVGKTHTVLTGYCVLKIGGSRIERVVVSKVKMRKMSLADIRRYVASGEPMDKAGSYAAQGLGMSLVEEIRGSYTNVVGLPMSQLLSDLEKKFKIPFMSWT